MAGEYHANVLQTNVSKPSAMDTTVHKVMLEAKGIACNLFDARAELLK